MNQAQNQKNTSRVAGLMVENTSILPARFNSDTWDYTSNLETHIKADVLTFVTYNTWFYDFYLEERFQAITKILRDSNADVIALQEITPASLEIFLQTDWVRDNYFISDISGSTLRSLNSRQTNYGIIVLSRIPIKNLNLHPLISVMGRHVLIAEFDIKGQKMLVATTHLESLRWSAEIRAIQLKEIFALLNDSDHSVLMGDFNFCSSREENSNIDSNYLDFWQVLRFDDPGYTAEEDINIMRRHINKEDDNIRIDRIMSRSADQSWKPASIDRIGMEPISPKYPDIFPSDHFGLIGELEYKKRNHFSRDTQI